MKVSAIEDQVKKNVLKTNRCHIFFFHLILFLEFTHFLCNDLNCRLHSNIHPSVLKDFKHAKRGGILVPYLYACESVLMVPYCAVCTCLYKEMCSVHYWFTDLLFKKIKSLIFEAIYKKKLVWIECTFGVKLHDRCILHVRFCPFVPFCIHKILRNWTWSHYPPPPLPT